MIDLNDVLLAMSNIPVDDPIAEIWGRQMQGGYKIIEYTGSLPITIRANGDALLDYRIYGADGGVGDRADITGLSEPLCGIQTYTDSLNLSTGILARRIKKLVLTGEEVISSVTKSTLDPEAYCFAYLYSNLGMTDIIDYNINMALIPYPCYVSDHFKLRATPPSATYVLYNELYAGEMGPNAIEGNTFNRYIIFCVRGISTIADFKTWLAAQYAAGTPVTIWYVLAKPDVSTIPVPSGLTGTIEGYLIQDGTPTPETPIYPTANGVKQADGTYSIPYGYKLPMTVSDGNTAQTVTVYIGENQLDSVEGVSDYVDKSNGKIVRMIGEYTFTGDESFNKYGNSDVFYTSTTIDPVGITTVNTITMRCNHPAFTAIENKDTRYWLNPEADDICCFLPGGRSQVFLRSTSNFTTAAECKAYLKAQYDNDTPVKISYWLKTPVEEDPPVPFPEIPTIDGTTTIDYDGTPKPSQMYVKYKGKR